VIKALPLFGAFTGNVHLDPRHAVLHGDAFRILARSTERWDLIVSEPSNPWVQGVDALFTREFYRLARGRLAPGGLFVQWIHIHDASSTVLGSVLQTLKSEFPHLRMFMSQANDLILLASVEDLADARLEAADATLASNADVARSLREIGLGSLESLLVREVALPSLRGPVQTLDLPVLHYLAGKSYFMGERVAARELLSGEGAGEGGDADARMLLTRRVVARREGALSRVEAQAILDSAMDRRGEEAVPLPLSVVLGKRLERLMP